MAAEAGIQAFRSSWIPAKHAGMTKGIVIDCGILDIL